MWNLVWLIDSQGHFHYRLVLVKGRIWSLENELILVKPKSPDQPESCVGPAFTISSVGLASTMTVSETRSVVRMKAMSFLGSHVLILLKKVVPSKWLVSFRVSLQHRPKGATILRNATQSPTVLGKDKPFGAWRRKPKDYIPSFYPSLFF